MLKGLHCWEVPTGRNGLGRCSVLFSHLVFHTDISEDDLCHTIRRSVHPSSGHAEICIIMS